MATLMKELILMDLSGVEMTARLIEKMNTSHVVLVSK